MRSQNSREHNCHRSPDRDTNVESRSLAGCWIEIAVTSPYQVSHLPDFSVSNHFLYCHGLRDSTALLDPPSESSRLGHRHQSSGRNLQASTPSAFPPIHACPPPQQLQPPDRHVKNEVYRHVPPPPARPLRVAQGLYKHWHHDPPLPALARSGSTSMTATIRILSFASIAFICDRANPSRTDNSYRQYIAHTLSPQLKSLYWHRPVP